MNLGPMEYDPETFLKRQFILPPLPEVLTSLMQAINEGKTSAREISGLIAADPGMVAQVLRVVNSAYYGLPREITDVTHAVAYLGFAEIYRIVLTVSVTRALEPSDPELFNRFWRHSYLTALISKRLVKSYDRALDPGDIYTASVLHDIGKLVYLKFFPEHYLEMASYSNEAGRFLVDAEEHFERPPHTEFGALLCERWQLPDEVRRACESHELSYLESIGPDDPGDSSLKVICLANLLANLAAENLEEPLKVRISEEIKRVMGYDDNEFLLMMGDVYESKTSVDQFMGGL